MNNSANVIKKIAATLICAAEIFSLAACVANGGPATDASEQTTTESTTDFVIVFPTENYSEIATIEAPSESETDTQINTETNTEPHTEIGTQSVTDAFTQDPTQSNTQGPTQGSTEAPTQKTTQNATEPATDAPLQIPTECPTEKAPSPKHTHNFVNYVCSGCKKDCTELFANTYGYNYLASNRTKGNKLKSLYESIDAAAKAFHKGNADISDFLEYKGVKYYYIAKIDYVTLGLSDQEAYGVWNAYSADHPLYYWYSNVFLVDGSNMYVTIGNDYLKASARSSINTAIMNKTTTILSAVSNETSSYNLALAFHDYIENMNTYAFEKDGETPEGDLWAHGIHGVFAKGQGVCQSYSRAFSLLLNACGIENAIVQGQSWNIAMSRQESHEWNIVKLDDGKWYNCDITWDDMSSDSLSYKYFCCGNSTKVSWFDFGLVSQTNYTFGDTHIAGNLAGYEDDCYPTIQQNKYTSKSSLRATFVVDGNTYAVNGSGVVYFTSTTKTGSVVIPSQVKYDGRLYTVKGVANINDGLYTCTPVIGSEVTAIHLPATIEFVADKSLEGSALKAVTVNASNKQYKHVDGVLYTKDGKVLVLYPVAKSGTSYVIPNGTTTIMAYAFYKGCKLTSLTVPASVKYTWLANFGYGYDPSSYMFASRLTAYTVSQKSGMDALKAYLNKCTITVNK